MANNQVIQLDGILANIQNTQIQTKSSNTFIQLSDRFDHAIDSTILFGSPTTIFVTYPNSVESALEFGISEIGSQYTIFGTSIESTVSFGDSISQFTIFVNSLVNEQTFGTAQLNNIIYINSLVNEQTFGTAQLNNIIYTNSVVSSETFGNIKINMQIEDVPFPSIESTLIISNPSVRFVIGPLGIASTVNFGTASFIDNIHRLLVFKDDNISKVGENDAVVIAGGIRVNPSSAGSGTATSGNATLPSNPVGFISVNIGGTDYMMPYYNA